VRASLALPGVFTPVIDNGEVLVDGGVMDNFPLKLMAERCESEHIIGVNINPYQYKRSNFDLETSIGGWGILFNRLNPFSKRLRVPSLIGTMMQSVIINSVRQSKDSESLADIIIYPNTKKFSIMDYGNFAEISKVGYEAAMESLPTWNKERSNR
jgi:predicted acylesterase/phospholipase RssA